MDGCWAGWMSAQQRERVVLFCIGPGIGADLLDAGGGAENHGNAARAGIGSFWGSGSGCAGNGRESGDGCVGENYGHLGGDVFVSVSDFGLVLSEGKSPKISGILC